MCAEFLTHERLKQFLVEGYLIIPPDALSLDAKFHSDLCEYATEVLDKEGNPGNNILPRVPMLQQVFDDKTVVNTLTRLLGPSYVMQAHRFPHLTKKGSKDQLWHRDSFFGYSRPLRHPQIRNVMLMYYPQKTTLQMGPTGVRRGTQYYSIDPKRYKGQFPNEYSAEKVEGDLDRSVECEAGSISIIHYDVIHRGTANQSTNRFMFKFQFNRIVEPGAIAADQFKNVPAYDDVKLNFEYNKCLDPVARSIWDWMHNIDFKPLPIQTKYKLDSRVEAERYAAVYETALAGDYQTLINQIYSDDEQLTYSASHGLVACRSQTAVRAVLNEFKKPSAPTEQKPKICLMFVLSEYGPLVRNVLSSDEIEQFVKYCDKNWTQSSQHPQVRLYLAEALGTIFCNSEESTIPSSVLKILGTLLQDRNDQNRFTAALSIARIGEAAHPTVASLEKTLKSDGNRYVIANTLTALEKIGTAESLKTVIGHLKAARWCHHTTKKHPF